MKPIFKADIKYPMCLIIMAEKQCTFFDFNDLNIIQSFTYFETPLDAKNTAARLFYNRQGYAIASIDGRANLTKFSK